MEEFSFQMFSPLRTPVINPRIEDNKSELNNFDSEDSDMVTLGKSLSVEKVKCLKKTKKKSLVNSESPTKVSPRKRQANNHGESDSGMKGCLSPRAQRMQLKGAESTADEENMETNDVVPSRKVLSPTSPSNKKHKRKNSKKGSNDYAENISASACDSQNLFETSVENVAMDMSMNNETENVSSVSGSSSKSESVVKSSSKKKKLYTPGTPTPSNPCVTLKYVSSSSQSSLDSDNEHEKNPQRNKQGESPLKNPSSKNKSPSSKLCKSVAARDLSKSSQSSSDSDNETIPQRKRTPQRTRKSESLTESPSKKKKLSTTVTPSKSQQRAAVKCASLSSNPNNSGKELPLQTEKTVLKRKTSIKVSTKAFSYVSPLGFKEVEFSSTVLTAEEIEEDDEIWLMKVPTDYDISRLDAQEFPIDTAVEIHHKKHSVTKYELHGIKSKEHKTSLLLPSEQDKKLHYVAQVTGQLWLSESHNIPPLSMPQVKPPRDTSLPPGLKYRNIAFGTGSPCQQETVTPSKKKKHKKRRSDIKIADPLMRLDTEQQDLTLSSQDFVETSKKTKKNRKKQQLLAGDVEPNSGEELGMRVKKKKDDNFVTLDNSLTEQFSERLEISSETVSVMEMTQKQIPDASEEIHESTPTISKKKKKNKKKKKSTHDENLVDESRDNLDISNADLENTNPAGVMAEDEAGTKKKKRKKKHKHKSD